MKLPRVYGILDGDCLRQRELSLMDAAEVLLSTGFSLLQLRWKRQWTRAVYEDAARIAAACRASGARFVINDRADVAMLLGAGVHTGQDDLPSEDVRRITGPDTLLGVSTHNEGQFRQAASAPVEYVALGPIYGTASKERPDPVVGTAELARLRSLYAGPLVAIGGITRQRAAEVWRAGADSVAVIGDLYPDVCTKASLQARAEEWLGLATAHDLMR